MPKTTSREKMGVRRSPEKAFGKALRVFRNKVSLSQEALAAEGGYHRTYIGQLERGEKSPSLRTIFNLSEALGIKPSLLVRAAENRR